MSDIGDFLTTTFPNYTREMYEGNTPSCKGHERVNGGFMDKWSCKYGGGESYQDIIDNAEFSINYKITIYIVGSSLWIVDIRYAGKTDFWEYFNNDLKMPGGCCCSESSRHTLEPDKIEKILNTKIENCKFWDMVQKRAKELYYG
jgi:hypothetical protein